MFVYASGRSNNNNAEDGLQDYQQSVALGQQRPSQSAPSAAHCGSVTGIDSRTVGVPCPSLCPSARHGSLRDTARRLQNYPYHSSCGRCPRTHT
jgi:hypothetical protein